MNKQNLIISAVIVSIAIIFFMGIADKEMFPNYSEIESGTKNQYIQSESGEEEMHLGNTIITKANLEYYKSKSMTKKIKLAIEDGIPFINMVEVLTIVAFFMIIPGTAISFFASFRLYWRVIDRVINRPL